MTLLPSWVQSANSADAPFPLNNLPYGVFSTHELGRRCGVAIGDQVLDLARLRSRWHRPAQPRASIRRAVLE